MSEEIERKFLVSHLPAAAAGTAFETIEQGYIALEEEGHEVRLRRSEKGCWLTVKSGGALKRREAEIELSPEQFETLWPMAEGRRIKKQRYRLAGNGPTIELDIYRQPLQGLMVAEVEFASEAAAASYVPESWMGREVTQLNFLKNRNLLQFGTYEQLLQYLEQ